MHCPTLTTNPERLYLKACTGFSHDVDNHVMSGSEVVESEDWQRHVVLILDEMHIREDLVYDKHIGALIGFTNLGDINHHLQQFQQSLQK